MKALKVSILSLSLLMASGADAITYLSQTRGIDVWKLEDSKTMCVIRQNIPEWGNVEYFMQASKEHELELTLNPYHAFENVRSMLFRSEAPSWKPGVADVNLGETKIYRGFPGYLKGKDAWHSISSLENGNMAVFIYRDDNYYKDQDIKVMINPYNFKMIYRRFLKCTAQLLPYSFNDIKYTMLHFEDKSTKLTEYSLKRLEQIAEYVSGDNQYFEVSITVHTDSPGELDENQKVTDDQAAVIKKFFTDKGFSEDKINVVSFGELDSAVVNDTDVKRGVNRRVLIEIGKGINQ